MLLKVCGNNDLESIIELEKNSKIDFLGFIFYKNSQRNLSIELPKIPVKKRIGVFVDESLDIIKEKMETYLLDYLQLHGNESVEFCKNVNKLKPVIKVFHIDSNFDFNSISAYLTCCDFFLFDTKSKLYGGSGEKFDWNILSSYTFSKPFFISGGISAEDIMEIKKLSRQCIGVDINSKFEIEIGKKNYKLIKKFSNEIR
jgi:phosphoribosylanthranilate isomerase